MPHLVTLGDSVHWGQGLRRAHKFSDIIANELRNTYPTLIEHLVAHSGAVIGTGSVISRAAVNGEVPVGQPTILEQLTSFADSPQDAVVVLVNGGINDVNIRNILNPFMPMDELRTLTLEHCYDSMRLLLNATVRRFPHTTTTIVATGYYPILSKRSTPFRIPRLLVIHGLQPVPPQTMTVASFYDLIVERCLLFWKESTECLRRAVSEVNATLPAPRILCVDPGFAEENAVFADDPWLWGLNNDLSPQDEVAASRHASCDAAIPWFDGLAREQCYRASAAHPNVRGASMYADGIKAALKL